MTEGLNVVHTSPVMYMDVQPNNRTAYYVQRSQVGTVGTGTVKGESFANDRLATNGASAAVTAAATLVRYMGSRVTSRPIGLC